MSVGTAPFAGLVPGAELFQARAGSPVAIRKKARRIARRQ